ncbi:MAG: hypothetical protein M3O30_06675 [Planctomycetota bacterium]|nr:hypothetical protein [Planctomycetota bacterium]
MLGQTFSVNDLPTIALLVVLEGVLSIDNALVLGLLAGRLTPALRTRALSYGLIGALVFRLIAVLLAAYLMHWSVIKLLGGLYLIWVALKFFVDRQRTKNTPNPSIPSHSRPSAGFWPTVAAIELTDIAFAVDSILAAVALVGGPPAGTLPGAIHPKLWVVFTGGMLGVVLMRFAAAVFARLLDRFPRLNGSAYLLVGLIGAKLIIDWAIHQSPHPENIDFQHPSSAAFWVFWTLMLGCLAFGFVPPRMRKRPSE